jgi:hypothetical protein
MSNQITFEQTDTLTERLTKIVYIYAGTHLLKSELSKFKIKYVKVCKGANTFFILRGANISKLIIKL